MALSSLFRLSLFQVKNIVHSNAKLEFTALSVLGAAQHLLPKTQPFHTSASDFGVMKFLKKGIDVKKYTMRPLPLQKSGGRGENGRIQTHGVGGGAKHHYRMVDFKKDGPREGHPLEEKVCYVRYDPCRTADIAVVATGEKRRYILASQNMKAGDIIKTSRNIPRIPVRAYEGDSHPVGALPVGTLVHNLEIYEDDFGRIARAAGTSAQLVRKIGDKCILRMPSKREICISQHCMATVGRVSNIDHDKEHIGSPQRSRWLGIRPQSGWWHRKTGYNGRKIRPIPPMKTYSKPPPPKPDSHKYSF